MPLAAGTPLAPLFLLEAPLPPLEPPVPDFVGAPLLLRLALDVAFELLFVAIPLV